MKKILTRMALLFKISIISLLLTTYAHAGAKGIYLTQYTVENTPFLNSLIEHAKAVGINTFIIDIDKPSKRYKENIQLVRKNNIQYVARIVMFPDGGTEKQINDPAFWQKKYKLAEEAIRLGASQIQLDYIRFKASQRGSAENAKKINHIINWYKDQLDKQGIPLQVDVFGVASFGESKHIGQNIELFAQNVDVVCPMVYPSHFEPFAHHYKRPYETIFDSIESIHAMFNEKPPFKVIPYIELSNYHYRMSREQRYEYIEAQLNAVKDVEADGWYAWSPSNRYDTLFHVLEKRQANQS